MFPVGNTFQLVSVAAQISLSANQHQGGDSGSVVECLTRDREAPGSSLTGVTTLWSLSKAHLS